MSDTVCEAASSNHPFNAPTIGGGCATFLNVNYTNLISPDMVCAGSAGKIVPLVAGAWTERKKMYHGGSFLKLADDNMDIQNPEAQNRELSGF